MTERFLKPCDELNIDVESMPVKNERMKIAVALWHCRNNGPVPGECLQVGMMILRTLDLRKLADDENPPFWALIGFLEWIKACAPEQEAVAQILNDLRSACLLTAPLLQGILKKIEKKRPDLIFAIAKTNLSV